MCISVEIHLGKGDKSPVGIPLSAPACFPLRLTCVPDELAFPFVLNSDILPMARPRKADAAKRTRSVTFWLTQDEFAALETVANRADLRVNELARRITRRGKRRLIIQTTQRSDPALILELKRLGNNLNQLTFRSHLTGEILPKVESLCDEIREIVLAAINEELTP